MQTLQELRTAKGTFTPDQSGLYHYANSDTRTKLEEAAKDATTNPPKPAWFWYAETPCPIFIGDDTDALVKRWRQWRDSVEDDPASLQTMLMELGE
jgi:hypothetical protein